MLTKQTFIYAIAGAAIGICAIVMLKNNQNENLSAERYQRNFNQMTNKINSLTDSMSSLTKLTLELDKSFKHSKAEQIRKLSTASTEPSNQNDNPVNIDPVNDNTSRRVSDSTSENMSENMPDDNFLLPTQIQNTQDDGIMVADEWQIKQQEDQLVSSFENHFSNQSTDTIWAQSAEHTLQNALNNDIFSNSQLDNISCRATLCKIDTQHSDLDSELVFLQQINARAGFSDTESFYTRDEQAGGTVVMTLYLSRDGHRLPRFTTTGDIASG